MEMSLKRWIAALIVVLILFAISCKVCALSPHRPRPLPDLPEITYTADELNMMANVVNGEVGGITGAAKITYADGTVVEADACLLHMIHARVLDNQVRSDLFPNTLRSCVRQYWSKGYSGTNWRSNTQWQHCRRDVKLALWGSVDVPDNVLAATCDPYFADRYPAYKLWAKVRWDTGWTHGTFYYYQYGG